MKKIMKLISSIILLIFLTCSNIFAISDKTLQFKQQLIQQKFNYQQTRIYLGEYRVTFYCGGSCCCGEWAGSPTASGAWPQANHTCACGEDIPYGTVLYVEGLGYYTCEDRGVGEGCIDIYVNNHSQIPSYGLAYINTYRIQ